MFDSKNTLGLVQCGDCGKTFAALRETEDICDDCKSLRCVRNSHKEYRVYILIDESWRLVHIRYGLISAISVAKDHDQYAAKIMVFPAEKR